MLTKNDLQSITDIVDSRTLPIAKDLKIVKRKVTKIEKIVDTMGKVFDKADVELYKRVKRIEQHVGFPVPQ